MPPWPNGLRRLTSNQKIVGSNPTGGLWFDFIKIKPKTKTLQVLLY